MSDHLRDVGERAASFAAPFGASDEARVAGLLHDLGKYSETFTQRLEGKTRGLDHWSAGAWAALSRLRENGMAAALAIQGHHIGLQSRDSLRDVTFLTHLDESHPLGLRLTEKDGPALLQRLATDGLTLPSIEQPLCEPGLQGPHAAAMLDVRMLFSALVDADFLATETHFLRVEGRRNYRQEGPPLSSERALARLEEHLVRLSRETRAASAMVRLRADLLQSCWDAGSRPVGCFTLSAPTGAGKTLAMLAFALRHAREHGLDRVVIAVPFLSIIEQTVRVYRHLFAPVFGDLYVLEHHSLAGTRGEEGDGQNEADQASRRLAENWDAPLVVTTSVQLLESLFANRPSATTVTRLLFKQLGASAMDLHSPELFKRYYQQLYDLTGITGGVREKTKRLTEAILRHDFQKVAELYRLIEQDAINVVVPYDYTAFDNLRRELEAKGHLTGGWIRNARPYTVNLYRPKPEAAIRRYLNPVLVGRKGEKSEDWFFLLSAGLYDRDLLGLKEAQEVWIA